MAPVGMLVIDASGAIVEANRQLELLFGYSRAELLTRPVALLIDGLPAAHQVQSAASLTSPEPSSLFGKHRNGRRVPVEIGLTPLQNDATWVLASVIDLTERARANEQFRLAIEAAPNGMMLVDEKGMVVLVNAQIEQLFGYSREELVGSSVDRLLPERARQSHRGLRDGFFAHPQSRPMGAGRELYGRHKDGREVPVEIGLSPLHTEKGLLVLSSIVDITERRHSRDLLENALHETEILLKELHHRAKNNLQLIASLLDLAAGSPSPHAIAECRDRINSIALVHEKLYQSGTLAKVELGDYLRTLAEQVAQAWNPAETARVEVSVEAQDISLPLESAVPCGLVINELITNAFKHAFPEERGGRIVVRATQTERRVELSVEDDGVGLPAGAEKRSGHIGLELVRALSRQLHADLKFETSQGTRVRLSFEGTA